MLSSPKVVLLGGAPLSGKTSLAKELASRIGGDLVSTDDIGEAVRAVVEPECCPNLHPMHGVDYREYYITKSVDDLMNDALKAHRALWPAIRAVAVSRLSWGRPAVIEGWSILPECVEDTLLEGAVATWLIVAPEVFETRLRKEPKFYAGASDETALIEQFSRRSREYNSFLRQEIERLGLCSVSVGAIEPTSNAVDKFLDFLRTDTRMVIGKQQRTFCQ